MSTKLVLLGVLLASSTAAAQSSRYTRSQDVKLDVKLSQRVKPIETKPEARDRKPQLTALEALDLEGVLGGIREQQEQHLLELIRDTPDSEPDEKAQLHFMLGELYAKQQRFWRLESMRLAIAADTTKDRKLRKDSDAAAANAKAFLVKAVRTYDALTKNPAFRNFPRMDVALFYYGYTLQSGRYVEEARKVYDQLLKNYPRSKYVPEAHLAFGDYFFEKGQLADAETHYRVVLRFPKSSAYWYAMYKSGWIHLNLARHQDAFEAFFHVAQATRGDAKQDVLYRASKKDAVRAYAEIGRADKALLAFRRIDKTSALDMLQLLADLYLEQGKSAHAIYVYQELMATAPKHAHVCLWQYNVAHARLSMKGSTNAEKVKDIENLVRLYAALRGKPVLPSAEAQECRDNAAAMSGELARAFHSEAARTQSFETLAHAQRLYEVYLDVFRDAPDHAQTQYFHAELLWTRAHHERDRRLQTERWEVAANAFTEIVKAGKLEPRLLRESAYAAVLAWKNRNDVDPRIASQADRLDDLEQAYATIPVEKPLSPADARMIAAFDLYITYVKDPADDELVRIKFLKANVLRRANQFAKAVPLFRDILDHHRTHEAAGFSAQLLLDTYNRMQRYDHMIALARELRADRAFLEGKDELVAVLGRITIQSMRKQAEQLEKDARASGDLAKFVACGQAYFEIYNHDPEAERNDEVLYNALVCYQDGRSISAMLTAFGKLEQYYATSKHYARALGRVGKAYGDIAFYDRAVDALEAYAKKYAGEQDAYDAMNDVVLYTKGLGNDAKAIEATRYFVRVFGPKRREEAANAMFSLTSVYEKRGDGDAVVKHLREYLARFGDQGGADRRVIAHAKIGLLLWRAACPVKQVDGSCVKIVRERAIDLRRLARRGGEQPTQCGAPSKIKLTVIPRDERKVKAALASLALATREFEKTGGKTGGDAAGARHHYAQAKLVLADRDFESYLALGFPNNLDFDRTPSRAAIRAKSLARFNAWLAARAKIGGNALAKYEAVLAVVDNASSIAAAARIAQLSQNQSDALFTAEIPKDVRTGPFADEKVEAFCDEMTAIADPLDLQAVKGFSECLAQSTRLGWFSEWSRLCERELGQIKPDLYPTASELRGAPEARAPIVAFEPPIRRLE